MARTRRTFPVPVSLRGKRRLLFWVLALFLLWALGRHGSDFLRPQPPLPAGTYAVERVVDGDTLKLADGRSVRVIGVDTPESVRPNHPVEPWALEASAFTRRFVGSNPVRLEFDGPRRDRYGRTLAHVWVNDALLAEALLRAGLARAETQYPFSAERKTRFEAAERAARRAGRGIWSQ